MRLRHLELMIEFFKRYQCPIEDGCYIVLFENAVDYNKEWQLFLQEKGFKDMRDFEDNA